MLRAVPTCLLAETLEVEERASFRVLSGVGINEETLTRTARLPYAEALHGIAGARAEGLTGSPGELL